MIQDHRTLRIVRKDGSEHVVLYDAMDADTVDSRNWSISAASPGLFYAITTIQEPNCKRRFVTMHVMLMGRPWIDHINHNGLDNRRSNLRLATPAQNAANKRPIKGAASRYKGVVWNKQIRRWAAGIKVDYQHRHLGYFRDEVSAAEAYDAAARESFGEFAYLNFPEAS